MRKIVSEEKKAKKKKRDQVILGLILVAIMFLSVAGYSLRGGSAEDSKNKVTYNGFEFKAESGFWSVLSGGRNFLFAYNPNELPKIDAEVNPISSYSGKPLYISSEDPNSQLEIYRNLDQVVLRRQPACLNESCGEGLPIKTCEDNFIIIKKSNESKIQQEENCVFIEGSQEDLPKLTERFLLKTIGID